MRPVVCKKADIGVSELSSSRQNERTTDLFDSLARRIASKNTSKDTTKDRIFQFAQWNQHREQNRYWRHMLGLFDSAVFERALFPCAFVTAIAAAFTAYDEFVADAPTMPMLPFSLIGSTLSLLLVFRTNAAYTRYWDARKTWGGLLNRTRDLARQAEWIPDRMARTTFVRYIVAYMRSLKVHIRPNEDPRSEIAHLLDRDELQGVIDSNNRPLHIIQVMTEIVRTSGMSEQRVNRIDSNLAYLGDALGDSERFVRSPIPVSYTRHTSRFILVYLSLLPLVLFKDFGIWTPVCVFFVSYAMLGVEEIGVRIEEPFFRLNLEGICDTCETNLLELVGKEDSARRLVENVSTPAYALPPKTTGEVEWSLETSTNSAGVKYI